MYTIALRGRAEDSGRGCRLTALRNYKETRDRRRNGEKREPTQCRLAVQMKVAHGWRLQREIAVMHTRRDGGDGVGARPTGQTRDTTENRTGRAARGAGEEEDREATNERAGAETAGQGRGGERGSGGGEGRWRGGAGDEEGRQREEWEEYMEEAAAGDMMEADEEVEREMWAAADGGSEDTT